MKKLGSNIGDVIAAMGGNSREARINRRAMQVRDRYRRALEAVYRDDAQIFLAHTNNVYILKKDGIPTLIVYVDESIFAAELNAQRELIKLKLLELFGEQVEDFEIHISRGSYKANHPYLTEAQQKPDKQARALPLDSSEREFVSNTVSKVEDPRVRKALEKAMTADMERKKGEQVENPPKNGK